MNNEFKEILTALFNGNAGEGNVVALTATDSRKYDKLHVYDNNYKDEEIDGVSFAKSPIDQDKQ